MRPIRLFLALIAGMIALPALADETATTAPTSSFSKKDSGFQKKSAFSQQKSAFSAQGSSFSPAKKPVGKPAAPGIVPGVTGAAPLQVSPGGTLVPASTRGSFSASAAAAPAKVESTDR